MNPFRKHNREPYYLKPLFPRHIKGVQIQRKIKGRFLPLAVKNLRKNIRLGIDIVQPFMQITSLKKAHAHGKKYIKKRSTLSVSLYKDKSPLLLYDFKRLHDIRRIGLHIRMRPADILPAAFL